MAIRNTRLLLLATKQPKPSLSPVQIVMISKWTFGKNRTMRRLTMGRKDECGSSEDDCLSNLSRNFAKTAVLEHAARKKNNATAETIH